MKRAREEDVHVAPSPAGAVADQPSPPKRAKMEWDGPPSEELQQRKAQVEGVKSEEEANIFFAQMSDLFKMNPPTETSGGGEADFTEIANILLKGCTQVPGAPGGSSAGGGDGLDAFVNPLSEPPSMLPSGMKDDLEQYFDFSLGVEDDDSKTPELTSSSSTTNTSPGSNSGNEPAADAQGSASAPATTNEIKNEESVDLTHLGLWKGIDGGDSAYFQSFDWKWDSSMTSSENPWAFLTS
jgi:hypothetical protein